MRSGHVGQGWPLVILAWAGCHGHEPLVQQHDGLTFLEPVRQDSRSASPVPTAPGYPR
jgi:hypothetical protein